jgi:hypothetical protein
MKKKKKELYTSYPSKAEIEDSNRFIIIIQ